MCMSGKNYCLNNSAVDVFLDYEPQPTSTKTMVHLAQSMKYFPKYKFTEHVLLCILPCSKNSSD